MGLSQWCHQWSGWWLTRYTASMPVSSSSGCCGWGPWPSCPGFLCGQMGWQSFAVLSSAVCGPCSFCWWVCGFPWSCKGVCRASYRVWTVLVHHGQCGVLEFWPEFIGGLFIHLGLDLGVQFLHFCFHAILIRSFVEVDFPRLLGSPDRSDFHFH